MAYMRQRKVKDLINRCVNADLYICGETKKYGDGAKAFILVGKLLNDSHIDVQ